MISGIIMASGFSRRMGREKLTIEIHGVKIIERVIKECLASDLDEVILVYRRDEIRQIGEKWGLKCIYNDRAELGQISSLKFGISHAKEGNDYMFIVGDQPYLKKEIINILIDQYRESHKKIVVPYYGNKEGMPRILSNIFKEEILDTKGDFGARKIVKKYPNLVKKVYIEDKKAGIDIDSQEDIDKVKR